MQSGIESLVKLALVAIVGLPGGQQQYHAESLQKANLIGLSLRARISFDKILCSFVLVPQEELKDAVFSGAALPPVPALRAVTARSAWLGRSVWIITAHGTIAFNSHAKTSAAFGGRPASRYAGPPGQGKPRQTRRAPVERAGAPDAAVRGSREEARKCRGDGGWIDSFSAIASLVAKQLRRPGSIASALGHLPAAPACR